MCIAIYAQSSEETKQIQLVRELKTEAPEAKRMNNKCDRI